MARRFREHRIREVTDLSGVWDFEYLGDIELAGVEPAAICFSDRMWVPASFDATPRYAGRRGVAAYRKRISCVAGARYRLVVDGAQNIARFFLDGEEVGRHAGGFTRFAVELGEGRGGEQDLVVLLDNRLDYERCPLHLDYFDWYQFGGIVGGVSLERLPRTWILGVELTTVSWSERELELRVRCESPDRERLPFSVRFGDQVLFEEPLTVDGPTVFERRLRVPGAELWSPENPRLYPLEVRLGEDDWLDRIGVRQVEVSGRRILLNGAPIRLLGVNRHESHPEFGHAVPGAVQLADLQLLGKLGANCVRGSHYPQDLGFLELCDELGVLVWNESIGWQNKEAHLCDPDFLVAQEAHIDEMITMSFNRPSVVIWGLLNESCSTSEAARPGFARLVSRIRERDGSRPVTFASLAPRGDRWMDLVDIVAINTYPGWYVGELSQVPAELDRLIEHLTREHPDKPLLISEIGGDALYGFRDHHRQRWTEDYQADLLESVTDHLCADARVNGILLWQYCDCRTPEQVPQILGRARGFNNKGIVDEYRRPKLAFDLVARAFSADSARRG